ncbi:hypothetical protein Thpro_021263 [Acidihalobacter prosperus]|uniref:Uncharacterized protein n=1 Tax=Acidihalobacter prosperus TaxID=160660 RepID=A0A1A6C6M7_9GAMM|nr:hypothetical protein Thpro_021263 [Acidihalobacter prosperus]
MARPRFEKPVNISGPAPTGHARVVANPAFMRFIGGRGHGVQSPAAWVARP